MDNDDAQMSRCAARVGQTLRDKWRLEKLLGVGGMAAVYEAAHRNGARAAIKLLHPAVAQQADAVERFSREAYIANKVGHEGTVSVLDDDVDEDGTPFLVMELLEGESVGQRADANGGTLPSANVLWIASQTLSVLECAHAQGIVHRDIKPENLFITREGKLKVLDFGIARFEVGGRKKTQTGLLMGTPGYMAPEQALGRWHEVDARTDLWAVGATIFNLLTGQDVHEGDTHSLQLIHAATRPARSLARAQPDAPMPLVQIVDRALAFDKDRRYADARAMRAEIEKLTSGGAGAALASVPPPARSVVPAKFPREEPSGRRAAIPREEPGADDAAAARDSRVDPRSDPREEPPAAPLAPTLASPETAQEQRAERVSARPSRRPPPPRDEDTSALASTVATPEEAAAMREFFTQLEKAIQARVQYGTSHKETARRFEASYRQALTALELGDGGMAWNVSPYAFVAGTEVVWEPKPPLDAIPYRLFSDGVRLMGLVRGLEARELDLLVQIWTRDPAREIAPEDDLVTLLWDADFTHVEHEQFDSFAEGDQGERAKFEGERQKVMALASFDTSFQLEDCWQGRAKADGAGSIAAKHRAVLGALESEAGARAAGLEIIQASSRAPVQMVEVDETVLRALAMKMGVDMAATGTRFVVAAASAFVRADQGSATPAIVPPLRAAIDGLATTSVPDAIGFVCALCKAIEQIAPADDRERLAGQLAGALVSPETLKTMLAGGASRFAADLAAVLRYLDATHLSAVLEALPKSNDAALTRVLIGYVERSGRGREADIGAILPSADVDLSLALLRILVGMGTPAAREAAAKAALSPHPIVRIEALGHVEGLASDRVRLELRRLLEDQEPGVRLATLRAIAKYGVKVAGPSLVLRIRSADFDGLPPEERTQALDTLHVLLPSRAEAVSVELLADQRLVSSDAHEQTRAIAAELLARESSSDEAGEALAAASKGRWRNSERVRSAASRALEAFQARTSRPPPPASQFPPEAKSSISPTSSRKSS